MRRCDGCGDFTDDVQLVSTLGIYKDVYTHYFCEPCRIESKDDIAAFEEYVKK